MAENDEIEEARRREAIAYCLAVRRQILSSSKLDVAQHERLKQIEATLEKPGHMETPPSP